MIPTQVRLTGCTCRAVTYQRDVGQWRSGRTTVSQIDWARGGEPNDNRPREGVAALARAFAGGTAQRVGWYRFYFSDERWEWSPENRSTATNPEQSPQPHNWCSRTSTPTTTRTLRQHWTTSAKATDRSAPATASPVQGDTRDIVVIGERLHDNSGEVIGTQGFYIDVTRSDEAREATISEAVAEFAEHRAAIEQAKGVLMYVYRVEADAAFDVARH